MLAQIIHYIRYRLFYGYRLRSIQSDMYIKGAYACAYHDDSIHDLRVEFDIDIPDSGCEACYAFDCPYTRMKDYEKQGDQLSGNSG